LNNAELRKWKMPFGGRLNPEWVAGFTGIRIPALECSYAYFKYITAFRFTGTIIHRFFDQFN